MRKFGFAIAWLAVVVLSAIVIAGGVVIAVTVPAAEYSGLAGLVSAVAATLAVVWFTAGLIYQARQITEQRVQFLESFRQLRQDAKRNAVTVARDILSDSERRALDQNKALKALDDIVPVYVQTEFAAMKTMLESRDPRQVLDAGREWLQIEGPAVTMMRGVQTAATVYFESIGRAPANEWKDPADFVYVNGPSIWQIPYFQSYQGTLTILAEFMMRLSPGRQSALVAYEISIARTAPKGLMKSDKLRAEIEDLRKRDCPVPAIADDF